MMFLFIPKNKEDSWFRKGFSITTPSNIDWQHISMNILSGHPPEVPKPFCLKFSFVSTQSYLQRFLHDSQLHKNAWEPGYVQLLRYSGRISSLFPWGFETPCGWTWSSWAHSAGKKPVAHCTYAKTGDFCDEFVGSFVLRKFTQDGPRHRLYR